MTHKEVLEALQDNLTIDVDFQEYTYSGNNQLKITINFDGREICSETCTINPTQDKGMW